MKKIVQIVTIPLDKKGFSINDLIKKPAFDAAGEIERWKISYYGMSTGIWKAHQLLVLSDDEIKINDTYYASGSKTLEYSVFKADTARLVKIGNELGVKKVIASYPQIEGTLPISKETVQAWIDSGTPDKGSLEMEEWNTVNNHELTKKHLSKNRWVYVKSELPKAPFNDAKIHYYERIKLTPNNEIVIVDELFEKQKELFIKAATSMTGSAILTPEFKALGEFATKLDSVDQGLEDAAKESVGEIEDMAGMAGYNGFIKGAKWQKERSLKDFYDHGYIEARVNAEWTDTDMVDFLLTYSDRHLNNCKDVLEMYKKLKSK